MIIIKLPCHTNQIMLSDILCVFLSHQRKLKINIMCYYTILIVYKEQICSFRIFILYLNSLLMNPYLFLNNGIGILELDLR